ncbi:hypothetical protein QG055_10095, partial [Kingella kingae]|uniref:hypothetical protein n=1 Tax=Kingella kingae TaxID=504 RepID=UPI0025559D37
PFIPKSKIWTKGQSSLHFKSIKCRLKPYCPKFKGQRANPSVGMAAKCHARTPFVEIQINNQFVIKAL